MRPLLFLCAFDSVHSTWRDPASHARRLPGGS